jgi:hypothetical protein
MKTLEGLLRMTVPAKDKDGNDIQITPEFRLSVQETKAMVNGEPGVRIIIHADGYNSDTLDYVVSGDELLSLNI